MHTRIKVGLGTACSLLLAGPAVLAQPVIVDPRLRVEVVAQGLGNGQLVCSTGFFFPSRGTILAVSRADGRVRRVDLSPGQVGAPGATVLDLEIVAGTPTDDQSEYGVQALEPHPDFAQNGWVYARYDHSKFPGRDTAQAEFNNFNDPSLNVIERYHWDPSAAGGAGSLTFDRGISSQPIRVEYHHGGPIAFDPQPPHHFYTLYGDGRNTGMLAQNHSPGFIIGDAGTIVRLEEDGGIPSDNPFGVAHGAPAGTEAWYAYGTRNSFGLTIDPATGSLWQTDNGEAFFDEVNRVPRGANLGWDRIMGPVVHPRQFGSIANLVSIPGVPPGAYHDPEFSWFQTIGVTAIHFLHDSALGPAWNDAVIVANFNTGYVWLFRLNADRTGFVLQHPGLQDRVDDRASFLANPVGTEAAELLWGRNFTPLFRGVLAIRRGPDGLPYFLTAAGEILRVSRSCPQDFNGDGDLNPDDLGDFITCYFSPDPCPRADFNNDGEDNPDDLGDFITAYFAGC